VAGAFLLRFLARLGEPPLDVGLHLLRALVFGRVASIFSSAAIFPATVPADRCSSSAARYSGLRLADMTVLEQ